MQNMKVDIVYYEIPADFEMEFNLSGCCPMRLLKTLTYSKKEYIEGLARAVSRSKIIIACGPVYGEDGLIKITSKATHRPTEIINNSEYGIAQDLNVEIIKGAVPLVTTSGLFGGLIIESGPQTIIILSENKDIRRNIMKNLIHAYVRDVSILEIRRNSGFSALGNSPSENTTADEETEDVLTEEDFEKIPDSGETVDFAEETAEDTTAAAVSDEALKQVAKELNDLSSEIGKTLYANDNTTKAEESSDGYEIEISEESFQEENIKEPEVLPESEEKTTVQEEPVTSEEIAEQEEPSEQVTDAEETTAEEESAPQVDFAIDSEDNAEPIEQEIGPDASVAEFLFDEDYDETEEPFEAGTPLNDLASSFEEEKSLDYAYILSEDEEDTVARHKAVAKTVLIIVGIFAIILLVLAYFFVYLPYESGINPIEYIRSFLANSNHYLWRG